MNRLDQVLLLDHDVTLDDAIESDKYHEVGVQDVAAKLAEEVDEA